MKLQNEYYEQVAVVNYLRVRYPKVLFTIAPQGMKLTIGVARKLKMMGYNPGCPDIMIFEPRGNWYGLFIELKRKKTSLQSAGSLTEYQKKWQNDLNNRQYYSCVCWGSDDAMETIDDYFAEKVNMCGVRFRENRENGI